MSLENLSNFIHSAEHSQDLRRKIKRCSNIENLIDLANQYGFAITLNDIQQVNKENDWFRTNFISPLRKPN